jgi:hypothetical protein
LLKNNQRRTARHHELHEENEENKENNQVKKDGTGSDEIIRINQFENGTQEQKMYNVVQNRPQGKRVNKAKPHLFFPIMIQYLSENLALFSTSRKPTKNIQ